MRVGVISEMGEICLLREIDGLFGLLSFGLVLAFSAIDVTSISLLHT
jgi:hypothetical protein